MKKILNVLLILFLFSCEYGPGNLAEDLDLPNIPTEENGSQGNTEEPININFLGRFITGGAYGAGAAEISAFDPVSSTLFVLRGDLGTVEMVDLSDAASPGSKGLLNLSAYGDSPNSIAGDNTGLFAIAMQNAAVDGRGRVVFFNAEGTYLADVEVGVLPDMVTFSPDRLKVLVANEGEPSADYSIDPEGTVSLIDISAGVASLSAADVTEIHFNNLTDDQIIGDVRVFGPGAGLAEDLEPEYISVSPDSRKAFVTCQENNAVAIINLETKEVEKLVGLGYKDHSQPGMGLDPGNDKTVNIELLPVWGMYQPDAIYSCLINGKTYIVTANEGDSRNYSGYSEEVTVEELSLDPEVFSFYTAQKLAHLKTTTTMGDENGDGLYEKIYSYGARSFSIWDENMNLVWDSGDQFEQNTAQEDIMLFNSEGIYASFDNRSDDKGPEPEAITIGHVRGHTLAFIGLERVSGIMVYDITDPTHPEYMEWLSTSIPEADPAWKFAGDISPEGLLFVNAGDSPTGCSLLISSNEVSGTIAIFEIQ